MSLTFPYSLSFFSDTLRASRIKVGLQRNDETSGAGDGRVWAAELARPLWSAEITLADRAAGLARDLEAKIDGLNGSAGSFLFSDPTYAGPSSGDNLFGAQIEVVSVRADRGAITLSGLPAGFNLSVGDRFTITYSSRTYYGRFLEAGNAGSDGAILSMKEIRPYLPFGVGPGSSIVMSRPYFKAFIPPGGYVPFDYDLPHGEIARGGTMRILQRL